ncbi:hypothetical protein OKW50_008143 [Paraburkholderia youngii]
MGIEILLYPLERVALEVSPVIFVDEARGGDRGPCGETAQLCLLGRRKQLVDGCKLVVLVFAHARFP